MPLKKSTNQNKGERLYTGRYLAFSFPKLFLALIACRTDCSHCILWHVVKQLSY